MTKKITLILLLILTLTSCRNFGFYQPMTLNMELPEGSPEFKAGWRAGCQSALATKTFSNAFVYNRNYGNGIYQHDSAFSRAWGRGWFACILHTSNFVSTPSMRYMPLE